MKQLNLSFLILAACVAGTLPLAAKISYTVNKHLSVNTYGGWLFDGSLELEDSGGDRIQKEDFDAAPFLGASITINL